MMWGKQNDETYIGGQSRERKKRDKERMCGD